MIKEVIKYYQKQVGVIKIHPPEENLLQIILIRHAEPDMDIIRANIDLLNYDSLYLKSHVKRIEKLPLDISTLFIDKVYHSSIARAAHTAEILFKEKEVEFIGDRRFREFERDASEFFIYIPLKWRKLLARMKWFLGFSSEEVESFKAAKHRVNSNADYLIKKAIEEKIVVLVAHGLHNRFLTKALIRKGWSHVFNSGNKHLGMQILGKLKDHPDKTE